MLRFVFFALALSLSAFAVAPKEDECCSDGKQHYRATIRHIESGGIGYDNGYTTLEVFLASDPSQWIVTPFLDARGHVFDNGKWAANAGVGLRALWKNRAYGINSYYDYRNAGRFNANQIGAGVETLGELFDFRMNGYLPVGEKTCTPYDAVFSAFSGNYMFLSQKIQSAMRGANAEFSFHFGKSASFDFCATVGPYYFIGEGVPATWGGKARISGTFKDILTLEISDSYDRTFHNKFQGEISLNFPFGPKSKVKQQGRACKIAHVLNERILQPVNRQEIIVIGNTQIKTVAIDPATGLPYFFVFVDNTSSSNGTYESPYHCLAQAQNHSSPNDILYVFPGDGTTKGMDAGIFLKASQKFWGSGVDHSIQTSAGAISIPAQSNTSPTITNTDITTDGNAVTLAANNAISGFTITSAANYAIYGTDPQSLEVSSCTIKDTNNYAINASFSGNASISLRNNQFLNNVDGVNLTLGGDSTLVCSNNTFRGQTSIFDIPLEISASSNTFVANIENNIFDSNVTGSIYFDLNDVVNAGIIVLNNTITNNGTGARSSLGSSVVIVPNGTTDYCSIVLEGNTFSDNAWNSLYLHSSGAFTTLNITASSNNMSNNGGGGLILSTPVNSLTLFAKGNTITGGSDNGIAVISSGSTANGNITINNNTITDLGNEANAIAITQDFSKLNLTILNNEISRCEGTGILSYSYDGIDSFTLNVSGNTISNCENLGSNAAAGLDIEQYTSLAASVTNNTLSGNTDTAMAIGSALVTPTVCLTLTGNDISTDYSLANPDDGVFNLVNTANTGAGMLIPSGIINPVQSCPSP